MATSPSAKRRRITSGIIDLNVGTDPIVTISVHESVLRERGGFFEAASKKQWMEGTERRIDLPDDEPDVIVAYVEWLYSGKIEPVTTAPPTPVSLEEIRAALLLLAKLYVFGENITDDKLCNVTVTAWTVFMCRIPKDGGPVDVPDHTLLRIIYEGTPMGSPLRRYMVYMYSQIPKSGYTNLQVRKRLLAMPEFLLELVRALASEERLPAVDLIALTKPWFKKAAKTAPPCIARHIRQSRVQHPKDQALQSKRHGVKPVIAQRLISAQEVETRSPWSLKLDRACERANRLEKSSLVLLRN